MVSNRFNLLLYNRQMDKVTFNRNDVAEFIQEVFGIIGNMYLSYEEAYRNGLTCSEKTWRNGVKLLPKKYKSYGYRVWI